MKKLSIIIPAYNEEKIIRQLLEKISAVRFPLDYEIILVDDHSQDSTYQEIQVWDQQHRHERIKIFQNSQNHGKGYSVLRGLEHAQGDIVVVQDADFEYDPFELPRLLEPILRGEAEVVYGSRFLKGGIPCGMAVPNYLANRFLTGLTNLLFRTALTDMETCYKLVRRDLIRSLHLQARRFDFEPELTAKIVRKGIKIVELPISYSGRNASEGKKIKARDFFGAIKSLLVNRFRPSDA